jgi:hypothetical protein
MGTFMGRHECPHFTSETRKAQRSWSQRAQRSIKNIDAVGVADGDIHGLHMNVPIHHFAFFALRLGLSASI